MAVTFSPTHAPPQVQSMSSRAGVLHAWHLLSLDAPTVAVAWTMLFARTQHSVLRASELVALFLAVWLLYVADRLLDGRATHQAANRQRRHLFHHTHRRAFVVAAMFAILALIPLTRLIDRSDLELDVALAAGLAVWFLIIHRFARARMLPKELVTGLFFAAATTIPALTRHPALALLPGSLLFAVLCTLNGLYISAWESGARSPRSLTGWTLCAGLAALLGAVLFPAQTLPMLAMALSSALLFQLDRQRGDIEPTTLRAAADLVLLTPLLVGPFLR